MKNRSSILAITLLALGAAAFTLTAQAVVPPPEGGYPNFTTAEGTNALKNLTTGSANTAIGWHSLFSDTISSLNTGVGAGTLALNTADNNTATGAAALLLNTSGTNNTANGAGALVFNHTGDGNTATGAFALYNNTEGQFNTAHGEFTLYFNTTGERNTAIGDSALYQNTEGNRNTAVGNPALLSNTTGDENTAVGAGALFRNNANRNTAVGADALSSNIPGEENVAVGYQALLSNANGSFNTAIGESALNHNITGFFNTAVGANALGMTTGSSNIALGSGAGSALTTGNGNICIRHHGEPDDSSTTRIGDLQARTFISGIRGVTTGNNNAINVVIDSAGQLGTISSSRRFKKDIQPMEKTSEALLALKPITFHYKSDKTNTPQFGLIAEEVAAINPDLVVHDQKGEIYTVRYDAVNAMLLNEFLKEHKRVQELESTVQKQQAILAQQQKSFESRLAAQDRQIEALTSGLQKVSAQIEMGKPSAVVLSKR